VDEDRDEYLEEGKKSKGKGKARQVDEDMDIDEAPAQSIDSTSTPPSHRQSAGTICIKQLSHPVPTTPTPGPSDCTPTPGSSNHTTVSATPCEKCVCRKLACVFREGAFACVACQWLKSRCMRVPEQWRRKGGKPTLELMDGAKTPQPMHVKTDEYTMDLGQVTLDYIDLSSRQGQTDSSRHLFHSQETNTLVIITGVPLFSG